MKTGSLADVILRSAAGWLSLSVTRRDRSRSSGPRLVDNPHSCSLGSALVVVCGAPSPPPPLPRALIRVRFCGAKSNSGCKAQGGWGGSAHYPDPTAQSAHASTCKTRASPPGPRRSPRAPRSRVCPPPARLCWQNWDFGLLRGQGGPPRLWRRGPTVRVLADPSRDPGHWSDDGKGAVVP